MFMHGVSLREPLTVTLGGEADAGAAGAGAGGGGRGTRTGLPHRSGARARRCSFVGANVPGDDSTGSGVVWYTFRDPLH